MLGDARAMIEALGGATEAARKLNYTVENARVRVNQWKKRGVPWTQRPKLARILSEMGYDVPADFLEPAGE